MRRIIALALVAGLCAASPAAAQSVDAQYEPIPIPAEDSGGSSGPSVGSVASTGSTALALVGLVVIVAAGLAVAATN